MKSENTTFSRYFPISRRDEKWGLYVTTAGEARIPPHTLYPPTGHPKGFAFDWQKGRILDGFALVYISSGSGKFESKPDVSTSLGPGHAFLLFPGVWHRYTPDSETGWHEYWLGFDGETARRWAQYRFISPKAPALKINAEDTVLATFSRVMQSIRANRPALQQILSRRDRQPAWPFLFRAAGLIGRRCTNSSAIELPLPESTMSSGDT